MPAGSWIAHIKKTRASMGKGASYSAAMKKAAVEWRKRNAKGKQAADPAPKKKRRRKKKRKICKSH